MTLFSTLSVFWCAVGFLEDLETSVSVFWPQWGWLLAAGRAAWVTLGCKLLKDGIHGILKGFVFPILQGKDRLLEWWKDEFLSPGRFPVLEDKNSWYKCLEFVDMIVMGGDTCFIYRAGICFAHAE